MAFVMITLSQEQFDLLTRPANGEGGYQRLLYRLWDGLQYWTKIGWTVRMTPDDAARVLIYSSERYGQGSFQARLRSIAEEVRIAMEVEKPGLQSELQLEPAE